MEWSPSRLIAHQKLESSTTKFQIGFQMPLYSSVPASPGQPNRTYAKMSEVTRERLFGFRHAFDDRVTVVLTLTALVLFLLAPLLILVITRAANSSADKRKELWDRYRSWIWLALFILVPILAGAFWTILGVATLSFLCYREYARITGLFRERTISLIVVVGMLLLTFAELDNWYRFFLALFPLTVALIATGALIAD